VLAVIATHSPTEVDYGPVEARIEAILNQRPAVGLAVGVVREGRLDFFHAHGVADIATNRPITEDTVFRVASITKTFTAIAVMQLVEHGLVDLDAPANDYLRAFKLVPPDGVLHSPTVRQLLTHTSGVPEMVHPTRALGYAFGESVKLGRPVPRLADYYNGGLRLVAEPGTRFMYTDHNFAVLGQIVENVSGLPIDRYLQDHVFDPLGMYDTDLNRSERLRSRLATGYNLKTRGPVAVTDRVWITAAASMAYSTPRDMARYVEALLAGGANRHGSVLEPATVATMFAPQYQPHPRVPGIGLAFSRFDVGGHRAVEHEGVLPGFNSDIFLAPDDGVGVIAFTNGARQAMLWLPAEAGGLLRAVLGVPEDGVQTDVPQRPDVWGEICGRYHLAAGMTDTRLRAMVGLGAKVYVRRGDLRLRLFSPIPALLKGFVLHPDDPADPYVFRIDASGFGMGALRLIFDPDPDRHAVRLHLEAMPVSLEKRA
jgi:CubicO group peptidase (beta-lactamase class C family)